MHTFEEEFKKADKKDHPVEAQWHYQIMIQGGFTPITKTAIGFVRTYHYENAAHHQIDVTHGSYADYWEDKTMKACGLWQELEAHLKGLLL